MHSILWSIFKNIFVYICSLRLNLQLFHFMIVLEGYVTHQNMRSFLKCKIGNYLVGEYFLGQLHDIYSFYMHPKKSGWGGRENFISYARIKVKDGLELSSMLCEIISMLYKLSHLNFVTRISLQYLCWVFIQLHDPIFNIHKCSWSGNLNHLLKNWLVD
jgi:hypothetical protein